MSAELCRHARERRAPSRLATGIAVATVLWVAAGPTGAANRTGSSLAQAGSAADTPAAPALSALHTSVEPTVDVSAFDMQRLQQRFVEQLPGLVAGLEDNPHAGDYEAHVHVVSVEPIVELLEPGPAASDITRRGVETIQHALRFWAHPALAPPRPLLLGAPTTVLPELELGPYPDDPRVLIEVFRRKGQRIVGKIEILFEDHAPHPFDLAFVQMPTALFHRSAQWGHTPDDSSVTRLVRSPIQWSVEKAASDPMLIGVSPALEVLRVQLSPHTDGQKRRLFERHGERFGRRDTQRLERPLWRLDMAENAVVIAVGRLWLDALARERGRELGLAEVRAAMNLDAPGVSELLAEYPQRRAGAVALIGAYTTDPMSVVAKLGPVLDR